ncbi:MAG: acyltransferase, partial [Bacillota bacterium]|nr:acyltransferase [Bacillota bacterium]
MSFKNYINKIIKKLGKEGYSLDSSIQLKELIIILSEKFICVLRGFYYKIWIKKSSGLLFIGKHCKLKHCHKLSLGKTVTIEDDVEINALSKGGISIGNNVTIKKNTII